MLVEKKGEEVDILLNKWRNRLGGCTSTSLFGNAVVSLRISLVRQLLDHSHATVNQSTQLLVRTAQHSQCMCLVYVLCVRARVRVCVCMCMFVCVCILVTIVHRRYSVLYSKFIAFIICNIIPGSDPRSHTH